MSEPTFVYREGDNDDWAVYQILEEDGERIEDWVADVSTEGVAERLIQSLSGQGASAPRLPDETWDNDDIQFPRLLSEIRAFGLTCAQYESLGLSMDLEVAEIDELLERAEMVWQAVLHGSEKAAELMAQNGDEGPSCDQCGSEFVMSENGVAQHRDAAGDLDYDMDADHVPYAQAPSV